LLFFLHDLASVYQISSKRNHSQQSYDVISISKILKIAAMDLEIYPRLRFWWEHSFSNVQVYLNTKFR